MKQVEINNPCHNCTGLETSSCCGDKIILGDICSGCGEHCDNMCGECSLKDEE